ncbi:hypothetical protein GPECTOR_2g1432 [Gonium pectorale]|uniref:ABC transporter domain-containing protein n=1 Tax=Gonium pectorale TaxID=33097 RepID=A0A150H1B2_GONPE|nr:hypothetical protein GPECTOR_2g1432 [Gonium pectorale]|eukprot:KXZ55881.1 hypothetical protein GPECTOR_2g1432 [Gonium pectorale]
MGPSGAGKTTLLDVLAGRKTVGVTEGSISFGGVAPSKEFLCRYTGYVEQFDTLLGDLTVREMLLYTAELKRPVAEPLAAKRAEVDALLRRLGLESCADVPIGDPLTKGISGGQAKRTNIGIALVSRPRVLFLDEPTSGLDSCTATEVMRLVRALCDDDGTTIAATVHGPTAATFALFDSVVLLARGHLVYFGRPGLPALQYAAEEWPVSRTVSDILVLHRVASNGFRRAAGASQHSGFAMGARGMAGGGAVGGDGSYCNGVGAVDAGGMIHHQHGGFEGYSDFGSVVLEFGDRGSAGSVAGGMAQSAFNVAEVLLEAVMEAELRGEAEKLAAAYDKSELKTENDMLLRSYLAEGARGSLVAPRTRAAALALARIRTGSADAEGGGADGFAAVAAGRIEVLAAAEARHSTLQVLDDAAALEVDRQVSKELATRRGTMTPWFWGLWVLLKYRTWRHYRSVGWLASRIVDKAIIAFIILTVYLGIGDSFEPVNLVNITASLFMWAILPAFGAASYVPVIILERRLFIRERADGLYGVFTYLAAKLAEELLLALLVTLAFSAVVFFRLQLQGQWVVFWLVYFVDLSVGIVLAYLVAALSPNMDVGNIALPSLVVTLLFFAGQLITFDAIPVWWQWYSRIDFLRYAWGALMLNQFEDRDVEFSGGLTVLQYYSLEGANKWSYIGFLAIFWFVFSLLALLALTFIKHHKR